MYTNAHVEAAIREAVFSMTSTMSEKLRESVANGTLSEEFKKDEYNIHALHSGFLSVTTIAANKAFSAFVNELKKTDVTTGAVTGGSSYVSDAARMAAQFGRKTDPSKAVLNEAAIKSTVISPKD